MREDIVWVTGLVIRQFNVVNPWGFQVLSGGITRHLPLEASLIYARGNRQQYVCIFPTTYNHKQQLISLKGWEDILCNRRRIHVVITLLCLTHWGRVTHICVVNLTTIGSDNGLSPGRRQAIIWTNDGILLIGALWTNVSLIKTCTFSLKKMLLKMSSEKRRPSCLGLNVLNDMWYQYILLMLFRDKSMAYRIYCR